MSVLEARAIRYEIGGRTILSGLDVIVGPGERVAIVGPSGSGKTSLLALLAGLAASTSGEISVDGRPVRPGEVPAGVATVLQGHGLVSLLTAAENVEIALLAVGLPPGEVPAATRDALAQVGLAEHADQLADELSGGQQQRVAVARAVAVRPAVLIADEPTAEQDRASRELVLTAMLDIPSRGGSLVLATHDPDVARRCDRVIDLSSGQGAQAGTTGLVPR
ncbi:MAG TPA: ATP-binding cassette domain-containing protein [Streptosporangiaceae bacterium]|nr:ATP-binding cassette domain-containing protein [Streptosporangiaceae bacterium]